MDTRFVTDADLPSWRHARACACGLHRRRRLSLGLLGLGAAAAGPAWAADEGVDVGKSSRFTKLVPATRWKRRPPSNTVQMLGQARRRVRWRPTITLSSCGYAISPSG